MLSGVIFFGEGKKNYGWDITNLGKIRDSILLLVGNGVKKIIRGVTIIFLKV